MGPFACYSMPYSIVHQVQYPEQYDKKVSFIFGAIKTLWVSLKIAFVTRTSESFSRKAEVQNRRSSSQSYVEDEF
jgi:hypothetical protein